MKNFALFVIFLFAGVSLADNENDKVYWKEWKGDIPQDAVIGGYGENMCGVRSAIFMGGYWEDEEDEYPTFPGILYDKTKTMKYTDMFFRVELEYKDHVKLVCARDPSVVTWITIEEAEQLLNSTINEDCVVASVQAGQVMFFGRTKLDDQDYVGRIDPSGTYVQHRTLSVPYYGKAKEINENYEILCYTESVEKARQPNKV